MQNERERELHKLTFRELYWSSAREEAFGYVWENRDSLPSIEERLQEKQEKLADPSRRSGPLAEGTSVRRYMEGFVSGVKDALKLLRSVGNRKNGPSKKLASSFYREILEARARHHAVVFAKNHDINEISGWALEVEKSTPDLFLVKVKESPIETDTKDRISDEQTLRNSTSLGDSLDIYYRAYLGALRDVMKAAKELGIETVSAKSK